MATNDLPRIGPAETPGTEAPAKDVAKTPLCTPEESRAGITGILEKLQRVRERPLFVLVADFIDDDVCTEVYRWRKDIPEELDVLLHSPGGDLNACYRVARTFARYANAWEALVPYYAASGATLICLGSSQLIMGAIAHIGPIDPQVISKRGEKFFQAERQSPLEAFQAVRYLRQFALTSLDASMTFLLDHGVAPKPALDTASSFASHLAQPILGKIDPYDLGSFALDSTLSLHYCQRIGNPPNPAKKTQRNVPYNDLVEKYPAHEFVIDLEEARALQFSVAEPADGVDAIFEEMRSPLDQVEKFIGLIPGGKS